MLSATCPSTLQPMHVADAQRALVATVASVLDGVYEPCALARGQRIGLVSAGLVRCVRLRPASDAGRVCVEIHASTTSHACLMYVYFEREVRRGLVDAGAIASLEFVWSFGDGELHARARSACVWIREESADGWSTWRPCGRAVE